MQPGVPSVWNAKLPEEKKSRNLLLIYKGNYKQLPKSELSKFRQFNWKKWIIFSMQYIRFYNEAGLQSNDFDYQAPLRISDDMITQ